MRRVVEQDPSAEALHPRQRFGGGVIIRRKWRSNLVSGSASKFVVTALFLLAIPAALAGQPDSVSGVVETTDHRPLMGAVVELLGQNAIPLLTGFTDIHGHYQFSDLPPGRYSVQVLQAYFLPARRKNILVNPQTHAIVDLTMMSLFNMAQWFPARPRPADEPGDDWKWTLRSGVDRPILRWTETASEPAENGKTRRYPSRMQRVNVAVSAGSAQFGDGGVLEQAFARIGNGATGGEVLRAVTSTSGAGFFAAGAERDPAPGDAIRAVATYRTLPMDFGDGAGRLQILQLRNGEQLTLSDAVFAQFGAETEAVQAGQNVAATLPFLAVHVQQGGNEVTYRLATTSDLQGLTDLSAAGEVPAMAMQDGALRITRSLHQEMAIQRRIAGLQVEAAYFYDHFVDPVLNGYGDVNAAEFASGDVLLDPITGAFRSAGPNYSGGGFRILAARQLKGSTWTALEYAEGPAIDLPANELLEGTPAGATFADALTAVTTTRTESVLLSMHGHVAKSGTGWNAGYRWQPEAAITAIDPFNTGLNAPFLSVTIHQPLGALNSSPDKLELEFAMQNILAQGYRPIYVVDGQTLYFAQAPRLVTGGLAFSF